MLRRLDFVRAVIIGGVLLFTTATSAQPTSDASQASLERQTVEAYAEALEAQDVRAMMALWHDGGELKRPFAQLGAPERHTGAQSVRAWFDAHFDRADRVQVPAGIRATDDPHRFIVRSVVTTSASSDPSTFVHLVVVHGDAIWTVTRVPDPIVLRDAFGQ